MGLLSRCRETEMLRGGKSYLSARPAFSTDAKRLLVCTGTAVRIFSTSAGLRISSLEGHNALVTSVIVVPGNKALRFCWTASVDGTIRYWDFAVPELMKTIDIKMPIFSMVVPSTIGQPGKGTQENDSNAAHVFAYLSVENTPKPLHGQIRKCNLTESRLAGGALSETRKPEAITISPSGKFFGIRNKRKLHIWRVPAKDSKLMIAKNFTLHHTRNFTVLAFHPTQTIVATGDTSGRILIWTGFGKGKFSDGDKRMNERSMNNEDERDGVRGDDDADASSTWHWHGTGISVLSFSSDGAYLYSDNQIHMLKMPYMEILEVYFRDQVQFCKENFHQNSRIQEIWVCSDELLQKHEVLQHSGWMCHAVGSYKNKPMTAAAFSGDGSVLAVAAENVITLWDPDNNALVAVIGERQKHMLFHLNHYISKEALHSYSRSSKPQNSYTSSSSAIYHLSFFGSHTLPYTSLTLSLPCTLVPSLSLSHFHPHLYGHTPKPSKPPQIEETKYIFMLVRSV
ncbi:WD repeat-containing protein 75-like [Pyrus ussuriensis x Pyrus communis]|uniref:WD repeat-containing protein 75-like n=1 Tax=Pyrus ussuriensis x Pyrus communis TaxID=2448454 RepID=A0A5N5FPN0_9ROSA|nr:WD repeat-containing protein 75-like [Pyrus ussuriensis x Pyrus communis]